MSADIKDFESYLERKRAEDIKQESAGQAMATATALRVDHVTHDPEWNIYLQKLQVHVDRMEAHKNDCMVKAVQPAPAEIHSAVLCEYWKTVGFLQAIDLAMKLPKQLMTEAKGHA